MGFFITDREIDQMIRQQALEESMASEIVRKGGVPQGQEPTTLVPFPRTVIDAYLAPQEGPLGRQYLVDLSEVERVRLSSQSVVMVYVLYSEDLGNNALNPGNFAVLEDESGNPIGSSKSFSDPGDDLRWRILPPIERTRMRLILSTSQTQPELDVAALGGPFSVALQADL